MVDETHGRRYQRLAVVIVVGVWPSPEYWKDRPKVCVSPVNGATGTLSLFHELSSRECQFPESTLMQSPVVHVQGIYALTCKRFGWSISTLTEPSGSGSARCVRESLVSSIEWPGSNCSSDGASGMSGTVKVMGRRHPLRST